MKDGRDDERVELPQYVKADDLAQRLNLAKSGVYALARRGELPHVRIGKSMRFDPRAVADFLRRRSA